MPLVFGKKKIVHPLSAGIIDKFIWVHIPYNGLSQEISEECFIGSKVEAPNYIGMTCQFSLFPNYYVKSKDLLMNVQKFQFMAINFGSGNFDNLKLNPDTTLLDIDEDFFSTNNPTYRSLQYYFSHNEVDEYISIFNVQNYCLDLFNNIDPKLKSHLITQVPPYSSIDGGVSSNETYITRLLWIDILFPCIRERDPNKFELCTRLARNIWCNGVEEATTLFMKFFDYIRYYFRDDKEGDEIYEYVNDITRSAFQSFSLPYHVYSKQKIRELKEEMILFLKNIGLTSEPKMITIAQSDSDGHTPKHLIDFIKFEIYDILHRLYIEK